MKMGTCDRCRREQWVNLHIGKSYTRLLCADCFDRLGVVEDRGNPGMRLYVRTDNNPGLDNVYRALDEDR